VEAGLRGKLGIFAGALFGEEFDDEGFELGGGRSGGTQVERVNKAGQRGNGVAAKKKTFAGELVAEVLGHGGRGHQEANGEVAGVEGGAKGGEKARSLAGGGGAGNECKRQVFSLVRMEAEEMKIQLTSLLVEDQERALQFYTEVLGFKKEQDIPMGGARWITVSSPDGHPDVHLALEPNGNPAARTYQQEMFSQGIPLAAFAVEDVDAEHKRLEKAGVNFMVQPSEAGAVRLAVFSDQCGNLIQIYQLKKQDPA